MRPSSVGQSLQTPGDIRAAPGDTSGPPGSPTGKKDGAIPYMITRDQQILKRAGKQRGGVRRRPGFQDAWSPREREAPQAPGTPPLSARPSLRFLRVWRPWSPLLPRPSPSPDPPGKNGALAGVAVRLPGESGIVKPFLVSHFSLVGAASRMRGQSSTHLAQPSVGPGIHRTRAERGVEADVRVRCNPTIFRVEATWIKRMRVPTPSLRRPRSPGESVRSSLVLRPAGAARATRTRRVGSEALPRQRDPRHG